MKSTVSRRVMIVVALAIVAGGLGNARPLVDAASQASPAQQLAEKYAPVAYLRAQKAACDGNGEAFFPAPVELVLGNPEMALKHDEGGRSADDAVVMMAPRATDLVGLGRGFYLDFPGNPRHAGCRYETDFNRYVAERGLEPTAYARIVVDEAAGKLILQYWLWYYFNDWNNTHETDWEMIQLVFGTTSIAAALALEPERAGYAQHGGGELASWHDSQLRTEAGRPVVYPAAGSHGTYFADELYIGWGDNGTGFGCDNTTAPLDRMPLDVVLLPDTPTVDGPFAWLLFDGRWGERQVWEFNGPPGPNAGTKWRAPLRAMEDWRDSSLAVPSSLIGGPTSTGFFCAVSSAGSKVFIEFGTRPWLLLAAVATAVAGLAALFVARRQDLGIALGLYRQHLWTFMLISVWSIPVGIAFNIVDYIVQDNPPMNWVIQWFNDTSGASVLASIVTGLAQQTTMLLVVAPPVLQAIGEIRAGRSPRVLACFVNAYRRLWPIMAAFLLLLLACGALVLFLVGIPVAIWLAVRWQFYGQAVVLDGAPTGWAALGRSADSVRGHWWQAVARTIVYQLLVVLPGPLVGVGLMFLDASTVRFANGVSSLVYVVTVPLAIIGLTLAYERFQRRADLSAVAAPAMP